VSGLDSIMSAGLSALRASQQGLGVTSQNIANANTPGYVRTELTLAPRANLGPGGGVTVAAITRAADAFLATAGYIAQAAQGASQARSDILSRAQASFGDPTDASSMFASIDQFWSSLTELGVEPSSTLRRDDAVSALEGAFGEIKRVADSLQSLEFEADQRVSQAVDESQSLMDRIASLNKEIQLTRHSGADASSAENAQSALIDQLSEIMDIRVTPLSEGGVHVRTSGGALLVGAEAATLSYTANTAPYASHGDIQLNPQLGTSNNIEPLLSGGRLQGLLDARDKDLPALAEALGGLAGALGDALNQVHNENSSSPAVQTLTGRETGLLSSDQLNFTGGAIIGVTDSAGKLVDRLNIDFDAQTITSSTTTYDFSNGANPATIATFTAQLNAALAAINPAGSADFTNGVLTVSAGAGGGVVVQQDPDNPAARAGRGFSHFFGLNDIASRPTPMFFESGISGADEHGLAGGGGIVFQVSDGAGRYITTRTVTISGALANAGSTWDDLITELNANNTGVGEFATFQLDPTTGRLSMTPKAGYQVEITNDSTLRGGTGVSFSALHGLTQASTAGRAAEIDVNSQVSADPGRLAVGRPDLTVAIGDQLIEAGDNRGAAALLAARDSTRSFAAAGVLGAQSTTLALYAARLGGEAGRISSDAQRAATGSAAVATAAADRRAQVEGVNIDDELVKMTTYQTAYSAAARVIQAATEMFDVLLNIGVR
jgi:flagellar hook-associated protein 1